MTNGVGALSYHRVVGVRFLEAAVTRRSLASGVTELPFPGLSIKREARIDSTKRHRAEIITVHRFDNSSTSRVVDSRVLPTLVIF